MTCGGLTVNTIRCRAKIAGGCADGDTTTMAWGEDLSIMEDGTFVSDGNGGTVICDACYIRLMPLTPSGRGLNHELASALAKFRENTAGQRQPSPLD